MDKLAKRFNAGEMIKANAQAEARDLKRSQERAIEYEKMMQELRRLNLKNTEITEQVQQLIQCGIEQFESYDSAELSRQTNEVLEHIKAMGETVAEDFATLDENVAGDIKVLSDNIMLELGALPSDVAAEILSSLGGVTLDLQNAVAELRATRAAGAVAGMNAGAPEPQVGKALVDEVQASVGDVQTGVADVQTSVGEMKEKVAAVSDVLSTLKENVDQDALAEKAALEQMQSLMETLATDVASIKADLDAVKEMAEAEKQVMAELEAAKADLENAMAEAADAAATEANDLAEKNWEPLDLASLEKVEKDSETAVKDETTPEEDSADADADDAENANADIATAAIPNATVVTAAVTTGSEVTYDDFVELHDDLNDSLEAINTTVGTISADIIDVTAGIRELNAAIASDTRDNTTAILDRINEQAATIIGELEAISVGTVASVPPATAALDEEAMRSLERIEDAISSNKYASEANVREAKNQLESTIRDMKSLVESMREDMDNVSSTTTIMHNQNTSMKATVDEGFRHLEDHVHKENVRVYRNVQAALKEETAKKAREINSRLDKLEASAAKSGKPNAIQVATLIVAIAGVAFQVLQYLGML